MKNITALKIGINAGLYDKAHGLFNPVPCQGCNKKITKDLYLDGYYSSNPKLKEEEIKNA